MTYRSKPGNCECGGSVVFYGNKSRGWACGRRDTLVPGTEEWGTTSACPIPGLVNSTQFENATLKAENIQLRNTISQLTEQIAELESERDCYKALQHTVQELQARPNG